ncbi:hypothetical protein Emed_000885 [Eimeria media]
MRTFEVVVLVGTSLLSFDGRSFGQEAANHTASRVNCLNALNAARGSVGLTAFEAAPAGGNRLPVLDEVATNPENGGTKSGQITAASQAAFLKSFCDAKLQDKFELAKFNSEDGTYMYASQTSATESCAAAVNYWKGAVQHFPSLPPSASEGGDLYLNNRNIAFVGLFNTGKNPTVDCAIITCDAKNATSTTTVAPTTTATSKGTDPASTASATSSTEASSPTGETQRSSRADEHAVHSVLCLSSPKALQENVAPFTKELWDKIKSLENGSLQPRLFGGLAIVLAALLHKLF